MTDCPICGVDVTNCTVYTDARGMTIYRQPTARSDNAISGGLAHKVGGDRCLSDAPAATRDKILDLLQRGIALHVAVKMVA